MTTNEKFIPIMMTLIIGLSLQLLFIIPDSKDTPSRAVTEFAKAYFKADETMADRLCDESKYKDGVNLVARYINAKKQDATERGLSMFYLRDKLYNVRTYAVKRDGDSAEIKLTAERKPPLKAFFTKEDYRPVSEVFTVVNDDGKWKVCGNVFGMLAH